MNRVFSILVGVLLILMGGVALLFTMGLPMLGWSDWGWGAWRLWPMVVVFAGLLFTVSPLLVRGHRGLGGLFIPGMPILTTGAILLIASLFRFWHVWTWLWPLEVLALASGFFFDALYMRNIWLVIPAIIVGLNGLVLQFCAITGLWHWWAVLWTIEPLSVGLSLMTVSIKTRLSALFIAGVILCSLAGIGFAGMTALTFSGGWLFNWMGPAILILTGLALLVWGFLPRASSSKPAAA
jgi:hypothetical protein